jgi:hypothetical protein
VTLAPQGRGVEGKGPERWASYHLSWDMDALSSRHQKPGDDGFRDAWCLVECRGADGKLVCVSQAELPATVGKASLAVTLPGSGTRRVLLRILTRQGVHLGSRWTVVS